MRDARPVVAERCGIKRSERGESTGFFSHISEGGTPQFPHHGRRNTTPTQIKKRREGQSRTGNFYLEMFSIYVQTTRDRGKGGRGEGLAFATSQAKKSTQAKPESVVPHPFAPSGQKICSGGSICVVVSLPNIHAVYLLSQRPRKKAKFETRLGRDGVRKRSRSWGRRGRHRTSCVAWGPVGEDGLVGLSMEVERAFVGSGAQRRQCFFFLLRSCVLTSFPSVGSSHPPQLRRRRTSSRALHSPRSPTRTAAHLQRPPRRFSSVSPSFHHR